MSNPDREAAARFLQNVLLLHGINGLLEFFAAALDDALPVDPRSSVRINAQASSEDGRIGLVLVVDQSITAAKG